MGGDAISPAAAKRLGTILAADVLKAYAEMKKVEDVTLRVREGSSPAAVGQAYRRGTSPGPRNRRPARRQPSFLEQVKAYRILDVAARQGKPFDVDVQVVTLGKDIAWVALPGECFVELGLSIKAASPFPQTKLSNWPTAEAHYIPNRSAFPEGQYEVVSTRYAEGAGETLVTTAIRMLAQLHREGQ